MSVGQMFFSQITWSLFKQHWEQDCANFSIVDWVVGVINKLLISKTTKLKGENLAKTIVSR
jgi:hypothetical protein